MAPGPVRRRRRSPHPTSATRRRDADGRHPQGSSGRAHRVRRPLRPRETPHRDRRRRRLRPTGRRVTDPCHDHQLAIEDILENHLHDIDWDDTGTAVRLRLHHYPAGAEVVIDPRFGWGSPVLAANKVKIEDVVALWRTGEPIRAVAEEYDLTETAVEDVLRQAA